MKMLSEPEHHSSLGTAGDTREQPAFNRGRTATLADKVQTAPFGAAPLNVPSAPGGFVATEKRLLRRLGHIFPGAVTWFLILALLWGPFVLPWPLVVGVLSFDIYWLLRSWSTAYHGIKGLRQLKLAKGVDWRAKYTEALRQGKVYAPWNSVHHVVVIPNLNERVTKLRTTLEYLAAQREAARQISVVLAMEEKEPEARAKAELLQREFQGQFAHILATYHPAGLPGEVPGKSSNEAWAARWAKRFLVDELGYDLACLTVTSCDADSLFHPDYFSCLTYKFCTDPMRHRRFWQAPIFLYNNIWEVPMPTRVISTLSTISFLADLCKSHRFVFTQSTYSLSLQMAHEVGYWDPDVIPEDWHMFLKCFFHLKGEVQTEAIFLPIGTDAVRAETYKGSLISRYKQAKRHAWGAEDIGYGLTEFWHHPEIPLWSRTKCFWALVENHLLWSTHWFILTLGGAVPALLVAPWRDLSPVGLLPVMTSVILTACLLPGIVIIALDLTLRPPAPPEKSKWFVAFSHLQWVLLPITSAVFASLPAVHAQTQLMLGKPLIYEVTDKV